VHAHSTHGSGCPDAPYGRHCRFSDPLSPEPELALKPCG
jgi:hypothetical protein